MTYTPNETTMTDEIREHVNTLIESLINKESNTECIDYDSWNIIDSRESMTKHFFETQLAPEMDMMGWKLIFGDKIRCDIGKMEITVTRSLYLRPETTRGQVRENLETQLRLFKLENSINIF